LSDSHRAAFWLTTPHSTNSASDLSLCSGGTCTCIELTDRNRRVGLKAGMGAGWQALGSARSQDQRRPYLSEGRAAPPAFWRLATGRPQGAYGRAKGATGRWVVGAMGWSRRRCWRRLA
jgi:hypothetical protein